MAGEKNKWWEDEREVAELIWCAVHLPRILAPQSLENREPQEGLSSSDTGGSSDESLGASTTVPSPDPSNVKQRIPIATDPKKFKDSPSLEENRESLSSQRASSVRVPEPFPLPNPAEISKALLPLARRIPKRLADELDIDATVEQTAEANGLIIAAFRPPLERWFEIHLLIDHSPSMAFWGDLAEGVATLFRWQGFFRDVRVWQFETGEDRPRLLSGSEHIEREIRSLIAPGGHRLFIVLTDTLGKAWHSGAAFAALAILGEEHPVAIAHIFPQSLWQRTVLHEAIQRPLVASGPECPNSMLKVGARLHTKARLYRFPIFNLSSNHFSTWAKFIAGSGSNSIQGVLIRQDGSTTGNNGSNEQLEEECAQAEETPEQLVRSFLRDASPKARELAKVLSAVPLIPSVMRLAQQQFLPDSEHWHLAEVFFSDLIQRSPFSPKEATVPEAWYEFREGIRELLLEDSPMQRTAEIWRGIGDFIGRHYGSPRSFQALIPNSEGSIEDRATNRDCYFAEVDAAVLMTWGGEYANLAEQLMATVRERKQEEINHNYQTFSIKIATITVIEDEKPNPLRSFKFETVFVNKRGENIQVQQCEAYYYDEPLTYHSVNETNPTVEPLHMIAIPEGTFKMGSPENEKDSYDGEKPQHQVTVPAFFMSQTPITQAQWKFVASLPQEGKPLEVAPSYFKGDDLPVENISWQDAIEFCARLSRYTGRKYRLPSEAEWEYACRGGTTTPFHFGETITSKLANYDAKYTYQEEAAGETQNKTTPVKSFSPNAFGLYDMHGNVWEWCLEPWHKNYKGAPKDGSVWDEENKNDNRYQGILSNINVLIQDGRSHVLRGGSWSSEPEFCRSACRIYVDLLSSNGFRVVCAPS